MKNQTQSSYMRIRHYVFDWLASREGSVTRLPSNRELAEKFGVSQPDRGPRASGAGPGGLSDQPARRRAVQQPGPDRNARKPDLGLRLRGRALGIPEPGRLPHGRLHRRGAAGAGQPQPAQNDHDGRNRAGVVPGTLHALRHLLVVSGREADPESAPYRRTRSGRCGKQADSGNRLLLFRLRAGKLRNRPGS